MKKAIFVLALLTSTQVLAGGASFNCVSKDGLVLFSGRDSDGAELTTITRQAIYDGNSKKTGFEISKVFNESVRAKDLPDFGTPVENRNTVKQVSQDLKKQFDPKSKEVSTKKVLAAIGNAKMLFSEEWSANRDFGHMVFQQTFSAIEVTYTPEYVQPDGSHFRVKAKTKVFQCESSYVTTAGGNYGTL